MIWCGQRDAYDREGRTVLAKEIRSMWECLCGRVVQVEEEHMA